MSKKITSGLTPSQKTKVVDCLDDLTVRRHKVQTLASLLMLCETAPGSDVDPDMVAGAGAMIFEEADRMRESLETLNQRMPR